MDELQIKKDICLNCEQYFNIVDLLKDKRLKRGYKKFCKYCLAIINKKYTLNNKKLIKDKRKIFYNKNIKPKLNQYLLEVFEKNPIRHKARRLKSSMTQTSKKRKMLFDKNIVNIDYIYNLLLVNKNCQCCGKLYLYEYKFDNTNNLDGPSIDRPDNKVGYIEGNIQLICWECNSIKGDATVQELQVIINWMRIIENNSKNI